MNGWVWAGAFAIALGLAVGFAIANLDFFEWLVK